jgi:hypothetical protein
MTNDNASKFQEIFEDSVRTVMLMQFVPGGLELQVFDRDKDTTHPFIIFGITNQDMAEFIDKYNMGTPGLLWSAGVTVADVEYQKESGQLPPGVRH